MVYGIQDAFEELAKREITNEPRRVLDYMFSKLDFENFIQLSQKEIIEILGINKSNVSKAIKLLTRKILEGPKVGRSRCYRQPNYSWKGKVKNFTGISEGNSSKSSGRIIKPRNNQTLPK